MRSDPLGLWEGVKKKKEDLERESGPLKDELFQRPENVSEEEYREGWQDFQEDPLNLPEGDIKSIVQTNTPSNPYADIAGFFDKNSGQVDEAIGRQFDDEEGGGIFDRDTLREQAQGAFSLGDFLGGSLDEWIGRNSLPLLALGGLIGLGVLGWIFRPLLKTASNVSEKANEAS